MSGQNYKVGEKLRVTVEVTVGDANAYFMDVELAGGPVLRVPLGHEGVAIERLVPADGMPKPGELWESARGSRLFVVAHRDHFDNSGIRLTDGSHHYTLFELLKNGPLTPIWREENPPAIAELRERLATTPFGDDEPETVPIGGISPGTLVTHDEWNAGEPVRIISVEDDDPIGYTVKVVHDNGDGSTSERVRFGVPADFQVTPVSPEVYL